MNILAVGSFWLGSNARSFARALGRCEGVSVDEIDPGHYFPGGNSLATRVIRRAARRVFAADLSRAILHRARRTRPDIILVFKGGEIGGAIIRELSRTIAPVVNIYPDKSPFQYGEPLRSSIGEYDMVISTKRFHPAIWRSRYGLLNTCVHVGHGYDPELHLESAPPCDFTHDVVLIATWRAEYAETLLALAERLGRDGLRVAIGGDGWFRLDRALPEGWELIGPQHGRAYVQATRRGRIVVAPVETRLVVDGVAEPGDEMTARSFELAGMQCFFIHRRTAEALAHYDEASEVPMYDDANDLAVKIRHYLAHPEERRSMAAAAHARAVPAYSHDARAREIVGHLRELLASRSAPAARSAAQ